MNPNPRSRTSRLIVPLAIASPWGPHELPREWLSIFVPVERHPIRAHFAGTVTAERKVRRQKNTGVYKTSAPHRAGRSRVKRPARLMTTAGCAITDVVQGPDQPPLVCRQADGKRT